MLLLLSKSIELPVFLYNIFLVLYRLGIVVASLWNPKAKKWVAGRKGLLDKIQRSVRKNNSRTIWFHCSSLGEFEQGKPIIEQIKARYPKHQIVLTFYSPSGYEVKKNYEGADYVFYLPIDSRKNARSFLNHIDPALVVFIKYDYWYYYLHEIKRRKIHCLLVSAVFRKDQPFFQWWGGLQRKMLLCFTEVFVQNNASKGLLEKINIPSVVSGDTRFDSVIDTAIKFESLPAIEQFIGHDRCIIAGSTWETDEVILKEALIKLNYPNVKLIIAPHEIHPKHLDELNDLFPASITFSQLASRSMNTHVLIVDNIGMLSRLYNYGSITYVGGGFTRDGVHNVLEPAVYGKPVLFGNNYKKYREAIELVTSGGGISFSTPEELHQIIKTLLTNENDYRQRCEAAKNYVGNNKGAVEKILRYIDEKRLLTN